MNIWRCSATHLKLVCNTPVGPGPQFGNTALLAWLGVRPIERSGCFWVDVPRIAVCFLSTCYQAVCSSNNNNLWLPLWWKRLRQSSALWKWICRAAAFSWVMYFQLCANEHCCTLGRLAASWITSHFSNAGVGGLSHSTNAPKDLPSSTGCPKEKSGMGEGESKWWFQMGTDNLGVTDTEVFYEFCGFSSLPTYQLLSYSLNHIP